MGELRIRMKDGKESVKFKIDNTEYNPKNNTLTATTTNGQSHVYSFDSVERIDCLNDQARVTASYGAGKDLTFPANVRIAQDSKPSNVISGPRTTLTPLSKSPEKENE